MHVFRHFWRPFFPKIFITFLTLLTLFTLLTLSNFLPICLMKTHASSGKEIKQKKPKYNHVLSNFRYSSK